LKFLIVDDHPLVREAVQAVVNRLEPGAKVLAVGDSERGFAIAEAEPDLDLVLLDLNMPGLAGIPALKAWRRRYPELPVAVLSSADDRPTVLAAIAAGAAGFIPKSSPNEVLLNALRLVLAGGKYLPPEALGPVAGSGARATRAAPGRVLSLETLGLTERQAQVLRLLAAGKSNKMICRELDLAERTVKAHISAVFRALGVTTRTQAAVAAAKLGMGADDDEAKPS
jgi:DNA-binding NarL/FixJ family response regulator